MTVFTPKKISNVEISNRLVRSATTEFKASENGRVTDELVEVYEELARGGVGLTITAVSNVREDGKQVLKMIGNYSDDYIEDLSKIAGAYHDVANEIGNKSKIFLQIGHCGAEVTPQGGWSGEIIAPSTFENKLAQGIARALKVEEIIELVECFCQAVDRAKKAGFDGVQLHGAHGYLITQFCSPFFNKRAFVKP